jgi:hypothetical protein
VRKVKLAKGARVKRLRFKIFNLIHRVLRLLNPTAATKILCNMQGVARHWRNPVRTRVTPLDSSDALYIVFLAYTIKPMDNVVRFIDYSYVRQNVQV